MTIAGVPVAYFPDYQTLLVYLITSGLEIMVLARIWNKDCVFSVPAYYCYLLFLANTWLLPFNSSPVNILATGVTGYLNYRRFLPDAFYITSIGSVLFCLTFLYSYRPSETGNKTSLPLMGIIHEALDGFWLKSEVLIAMLFVVALMAAFLVGLGVPLLRGRELGQINTGVRPFINLYATVCEFTLFIAATAQFIRPRFASIALLMVAAFALLLVGIRGGLLAPLVLYLILQASWRRERNIFKIAAILAIFVAAAESLSNLRGNPVPGQPNVGAALKAASAVFYGNNFSDLRDYAWVLSGWDNNYLYGKTYLAGMLGFIPSALFPLREQWSWGPLSVKLSHISDPNGIHQGTRPSFVGEAFMNFGIPGIVLVAMAYGFIVASCAGQIADARASGDRKRFGIWVSSLFLYASMFGPLMVSSGFFVTYTTAFLLAGGVIVADLISRHVRPRPV